MDPTPAELGRQKRSHSESAALRRSIFRDLLTPTDSETRKWPLSKGSLICKTTTKILIVLIFIVPERVALVQCPDCAGEIKRIDARGQCHSCFPCPECIDGYSTSSVPCGAAVPYGTDIHCVEIIQHPQESSQTSHGTFATTANLDISATSSLVHAGSSITKNGESRSTRGLSTENKLPLGSHSNWKKQATVYILGGISVVILFLALGCSFQERSKGKSQTAEITADALSSLHPHPVQSWACQNDEACYIDFESSCAVYQCGHSSEMGDNSLDTLPDLTDGTENISSGTLEKTTDIELTDLPDHHQVQAQPPVMPVQPVKPERFAKPAVETQDISTTGRYLPVTSETSMNGTPQDLQNNLFSKKISAIPFKFYSMICTKLNIKRPAFDDFRLLGEVIGLSKDDTLWLGQLENPTDQLITNYYSTQEGSCVGKFQEILESMQRHDVVDVIDEWVKYETDECNSSRVS